MPTILNENGRYFELTLCAHNLFPKVEEVAHSFVVELEKENNTFGMIEKESQISINFTSFGADFDVTENGKFEKVKHWGNRNRQKVGDDGMMDSEVYFDFLSLMIHILNPR